ncbi:Peptidyl-tRNA hydrolase [Helicobacter heilmannii]|uniref:Peptidyl-tRNA hydrolase n=1 Tax=Helicobacter heilmannii TaxID=35817 RepID=A0A0K2XXE5_HELHE|nr:aminoacyl-tRNA hydrolase [Helicobacter heilmannii]CCM12227.1 Peptidyl-tRNA hydrolase [Helicobacter heilmannii ASB1.4]CRF46732.1 Peptidyl-tRNA hydrolase [Helicobacter heilmannii]CRF47953.1 Peptidyl-tRNA hydrolase [Helicobacter heilmannii]CRF49528.1 Peptidyl-tRNA hydrolase [Helicobacter heilmannii]CRF50189.1 Peptidyl-tRNA hydrolase [Helicobacter heilmannii]
MLLVGLGNPTATYAHTRHNVGFDILDLLAQSFHVNFKHSKLYQGSYTKIGTAYLLKPTTYMNNSGQAVQAFLSQHRVKNILVVHDDLDLPLGAVRFKAKGSSGGHNGLKSIMAHCTHPFYKMKIGIGRGKSGVIAHVLERFSLEERPLLNEILEHAKEALLFYLEKGDFYAMQNQFTRRA